MAIHDAVNGFMACARAILAREGATEVALRQIGDELRALAQTPGLIPATQGAALHQGDASITTLHSDGPQGLTLYVAQMGDAAPTPIHDHNSWGVACVIAGRDRYQHFERLDDGADGDRAHLRLLYERELQPGDVVVWTAPPHDIHRQQGIAGPAWELLLFGIDVMALPRHYFDMEHGAVRTAMPS
ncbi:MAG: hypothetical protein IVW57_18475 [Ktedonobacterales bacterium]|nr:hypothetical protein [Ktedonobacterales bacterium]